MTRNAFTRTNLPINSVGSLGEVTYLGIALFEAPLGSELFDRVFSSLSSANKNIREHQLSNSKHAQTSVRGFFKASTGNLLDTGRERWMNQEGIWHSISGDKRTRV